MHEQHQRVAMGVVTQQHEPGQWPGQQVEGLCGQGLHPRRPFGQRDGLFFRQPDGRHRGQHALPDRPPGRQQELRAQRGMAQHQLVHGTMQRLRVQRAADLQGTLDHIGRAGRIQLPEEPLPHLRRRQRLRKRAVFRCQGNGAVRGRQGTCLHLLAKRRHAGRHVVQPGMFEHVGWPEWHPIPAGNAGGQRHRRQGIATQHEEMAVPRQRRCLRRTERLVPVFGQFGCQPFQGRSTVARRI